MTATERMAAPGRPRILAVQVTTGWNALPSVPEGTYTVLLRHRGTNTAKIYLADKGTPAPGGLDRVEWDKSEGPIYIEAANLQFFFARSETGTQILEIIAQKGYSVG